MCNLENKIFESQPNLKPTIYCRYVDDIFVLSKDIDQVLKLRNALINNSILNFTYELEKSKKLNFLDVTVTRGSNGLTTSVYVKPTYDNQTLNYLSIAPLKYKISTIKTLLHRGFHVSDSWNTFHTEVIRIKNLLNNNNFPIKLIDNYTAVSKICKI